LRQILFVQNCSTKTIAYFHFILPCFCLFLIQANYYVTAGASSDKQTAAGAPLPALGKMLGKVGGMDWQGIVEKGITKYSKRSTHKTVPILPRAVSNNKEG
jgi:hypothetical protein